MMLVCNSSIKPQQATTASLKNIGICSTRVISTRIYLYIRQRLDMELLNDHILHNNNYYLLKLSILFSYTLLCTISFAELMSKTASYTYICFYFSSSYYIWHLHVSTFSTNKFNSKSSDIFISWFFFK